MFGVDGFWDYMVLGLDGFGNGWFLEWMVLGLDGFGNGWCLEWMVLGLDSFGTGWFWEWILFGAEHHMKLRVLSCTKNLDAIHIHKLFPSLIPIFG